MFRVKCLGPRGRILERPFGAKIVSCELVVISDICTLRLMFSVVDMSLDVL